LRMRLRIYRNHFRIDDWRTRKPHLYQELLVVASR
jgi:hypothetical protein